MDPKDENMLIEAAMAAREQAYAPYSNYKVGAALLCASGEVVAGCNVENASYGLTMCAERVAVASAIAKGHRQFVGIAIATEDGGPPCGACRQVLSEFSNDLPTLLVAVNKPDAPTMTSLDVLLPSQFELGGDQRQSNR